MTIVRPLPPRLTEAQFQRVVVDFAIRSGWMVHHSLPSRVGNGWATALTGHPGLPDLVLCRAGTVLLAELKTERGRTSAAQNRWLTELGECARLWRPSSWPAIVAELRAPKRAAA